MRTIKNLPTSPGCYLFRDNLNTVIYVGKAQNIKKRVQSYFQHHDLDPKTLNLVASIDSFDCIATDTEVEAFILENTLIKKYHPKYNIRLRDAKTYAYIQMTDDMYPRLLIARKKTTKGTYFGPFISAQERDYLLRFLRKTFMIRTCKKMPKKPCLRHHLHLCTAPCAGYITHQDYLTNMQQVRMVLNGKTKELINDMTHTMKTCAETQHYEKALLLREQITALESLSERQNMQRPQNYDQDIINYTVQNNTVYLLLFNIYKGTLTNKNEFVFDYNDDFFEEFLIQYYSENPIPKEIILPHQVSTSFPLFLTKKTRKKILITIPKKGVKKQLLKLVEKNIDITFFADTDKTQALQHLLNLHEPPAVIECFDISHLSGTSTVGSMVQFRNGKPDKSNYRRFRIRTVDGIDDVAAIAEIVRRRYIRLKNEDAELPGLIIIDGGRGQLNIAVTELLNLGLHIPVIALAKHFEEIYQPGTTTPLRLAQKDKALNFIKEIRDEAHRFAITYNRLLRKKELIP